MDLQIWLYAHHLATAMQADNQATGAAKGKMLNLDNLVWLQTSVSDGWHNASQGFWLKVEEHVDCTYTTVLSKESFY